METTTKTTTAMPMTTAGGTAMPAPAVTPVREDHDPFCLSTDTARALLRRAPWQRVVVMGDSVAAGLGDPTDGYRPLSWADRMVEALDTDPRHPVTYVNLGQRDLKAHEIRAQQLDLALGFAPDLVVVTAGGNDMLRRSFDATRVRPEIDAIVAPLRWAGAEVVTFGLLDLSKAPFIPETLAPGLHERLHALGDVTREVASRRGAIHVDFLGHPLAGDPSIWSADNLHVNGRGHAVVAGEVIRALSRHLAAARLAG